MNKLLLKYNELILRTNPNKAWKATRFFLHWITLPLKLAIIGSLGLFQIVRKKITVKQTPVPAIPTLETKKAYFNKILARLPVFNNQEIQLYTTRVPYRDIANGSNHNTDHQCARQGTYAFLMDKLGMRNEQIDSAVNIHMQNKWLCRGYSRNPYEDEMVYNVKTVSGDMLCGLNMSMMGNPDDLAKDKYEILINTIIDSDYALLAHDSPDDETQPIYDELLKEAGMRREAIKMKSARGMWQPGLETVGAQALTLLASLRVGDKVCKSPAAKKEYKKMLWLYGYGLLSIFPTAYIDSQRGYFNDHNCIISLYTLSRLADSKLGKIFWKIPMLYVWMLSRHWYNGYFTGLLNEVHPGTVSDKYVETCKAYLYQEEPNAYNYLNQMTEKSVTEPVKYNNLDQDEFSPDIKRNITVIPTLTDTQPFKTGLGFIAEAIMLEKNPKDLL